MAYSKKAGDESAMQIYDGTEIKITAILEGTL